MAEDFRRIALSLAGTCEAPHFDRTAFRVDRIYATLSPDGSRAHFRFTPEEQAIKCQMAPDVFAPIANAWGRQGWTVGILAAMTDDDLHAALRMSWARAAKPARASRRSKPTSGS